ncbi:MAG TPA: hypothetical protein VLJ61_18875 [Pyrinomonadaceae bacterium]|nr:hypothetical protein [Pyrinomonadaceae bacterium]
MALQAGDQTATNGMTKAIFDQLDAALGPAVASLPSADRETVRDGWRKLAAAIAGGVVGHIVANMEIFGIEVGVPTETGATQTGPTTGHVA